MKMSALCLRSFDSKGATIVNAPFPANQMLTPFSVSEKAFEVGVVQAIPASD